MYDIEQPIELIGGKMYFFVVIEIIHFLDLAEKGISEGGVHNRCDLE
jgi:hypothetical protein